MFTQSFPAFAVSRGNTVIVSMDEKGYVYIWSDTGPNLKDKFKVSMNKPTDLRVSPNGSYIAVGGDRVEVYTHSGKKILSYKNTSFTNKVVWFPDSKKILAIQNKGVVLISLFGDSTVEADAETGCPLVTGDVSSDGSFFITGSCDGRVDVWSVELMKPYKVLEDFRAEVKDIVYTPSGKVFVLTDVGLKVYDSRGWKTLAFLGEKTYGSKFISVSPTENFAIFGGSSKRVYLWDMKNNRLFESEEFFHWVMDGVWLENPHMFAVVSADKTGRVYRIKPR